MTEFQILFNAAFTIISIGLGWLMRSLFETIRDLRTKDQAIYDKVSELAVTLPENYVSKSDFKELYERIFDVLNRIETKLDKKVDK